MEKESLQHLGNLTTMLEDAALFPFVDDIGDDIKELVGEEGDFDEKADSAEDFFNISEMLDDTDSLEENKDDASDCMQDKDCSTEDNSASLDPLQMPTTNSCPVANNEEIIANEKSSSILPKQHSASPTLGKSVTRPLASLRPERYKNANVKDFFPEFKENAPLRFSELFPVKESLKPSIWKRLRKRKAREEGGENEGLADEKKMKRGWVNDYAPIEDFVLAECDSVR